jgi:hypothetical protein
MKRIVRSDRQQTRLLPAVLEDIVGPDNLVGVEFQFCQLGIRGQVFDGKVRIGKLLPLPTKRPGDGQAQRACARPGATMAVVQTRKETGAVERLPGPTAVPAVWLVAVARAGGVAESVSG